MINCHEAERGWFERIKLFRTTSADCFEASPRETWEKLHHNLIDYDILHLAELKVTLNNFRKRFARRLIGEPCNTELCAFEFSFTANRLVDCRLADVMFIHPVNDLTSVIVKSFATFLVSGPHGKIIFNHFDLNRHLSAIHAESTRTSRQQSQLVHLLIALVNTHSLMS